MDCCRNWDIIWTDGEIEKLKNSEHSESLDKLIQRSFLKCDGITNSIKLSDDGDCPFHDKEDGLCKIQKELGAESVSYTHLSSQAKSTDDVLNVCNNGG